MAIGGRGVTVRINEAAVAALVVSAPVAADLNRRLEAVTQEAKRLCPVSPAGSGDNSSGYLRSSIGWEMSRDGLGLYGRVGTNVDYALMVEFPTKPHVIESHGNYPLRNRRTGQIFGRRVNHPGTSGQPFLRPALDAARGI